MSTNSHERVKKKKEQGEKTTHTYTHIHTQYLPPPSPFQLKLNYGNKWKSQSKVSIMFQVQKLNEESRIYYRLKNI